VTSNYVEGHNLAIEYRDAEGKLERLPALAAELDGPGRLLRGQGGGCASGHDDINLERNHQGARECSDCDAKLDVHQRAKTPRGPRGKEPAAGGVPTEGVCRCRGPHGLWTEPSGSVPARRDLRGQDPQRREARGSPHRAAHHFRAGDQSQDCEGPWADDPADAVAAGRSGDPIAHARPTRPKEMRMHRALLLAAVFALSPLDGVAGEKQIVDVRELMGSWRGGITGAQGDESATMNVLADGSYKASTVSGSTLVGKFYLQDGKLRYRSSRTTPLAMPTAPVPGTASVSEDKDKTVLTMMPDDPVYWGKAEYERVK